MELNFDIMIIFFIAFNLTLYIYLMIFENNIKKDKQKFENNLDCKKG